ncbi:MAG: aminoglycoside 6-adenylyltransferase [Hungatella sp.]|jgi:aminoglycoside 6-adenylyltransferase|nr:aminoglycoside 6-adenylyltransferase [Hungatella sp.]
MRSEKEMFDLILRVAQADERIRAAYMNGSRANPLIEKDIYQDYDIVFVVTETLSFLSDKSWVNVFGEIAVMQEADSNDFGWGSCCDITKSYGWLILFKDGNRIDLRILTEETSTEHYFSDSLTVPLLDKDHILPQIPQSSDTGYWIKTPTKQMYDGCCNEFWWCLNNVAKGIKRDQIPYAMRMYTEIIHVQLDKMIEWYIAMNHDFSVSTGIWGKYYKKYLPQELYEKYLKTYSDGNPENLWNAVFTACDLFRFLAQKVSCHLGYSYCKQDDENMVEYISNVKNTAH